LRRSVGRAIRACSLAALCGASFATTPALASPGDADHSFGIGGIVKLDVDPSSSNVDDEVALDSRGMVVVLTRSAEDRSSLLRLTPAGSLDRRFGGGDGIVSLPDGPWTALAVQPDGGLLVAGAWTGTFHVARYDEAGYLDPGFGGGSGMVAKSVEAGVLVAGRGELQAGVTKLGLQPDGRVVVLGYLVRDYEQGRRDVIMRFLSDGRQDPGFGENSLVVLTPISSSVGPPHPVYFSSLAVQGDGKLLLGGDINQRLAIVRLSTAGALDESWGGDGIVVSSFETNEADDGIGGNSGDAKAVLIQSGRRIVAVGKFTLIGLRPDGGLDPSFGVKGQSFPSGYNGPFPEIEDAALDSKGRVLAVGGTRDRTAILRFLPDGGLDRRFARDGIARPNVSRVREVVGARAQESGNAIVVTGKDRPITAGWAFASRKHAVLALTERLGWGRPDHSPPRAPVTRHP
jgi:uncharacterized delta-60 repeat protein